MEIDLFRGLVTVALLVLFIALIAWTWSRKRKDTYEKAARMPLNDDDRPASENLKEQSE